MFSGNDTLLSLLQTDKSWSELGQQLFNPFELDLQTWMTLLVIKMVAIYVWDKIVENFFGRCVFGGKMLASRDTDTFKKNKAKNKLVAIDYTFLVINQFIEMVWVYQVVRFATFSTDVVRDFEFGGWDVGTRQGATIWNTLIASCFFILLDDAIYAAAHRLMHWKPLYPLIHKHHHRQKFPERGYLDAGNEHPLEQVIGLSIMFASMLVTTHFFGIHLTALILNLVFYAFVNVINHTSYDIQLRFLGYGFEYTVGAHEMHHRFFDCNYGKSCMWFDKLMGTFEPYTKGKRPKAQK